MPIDPYETMRIILDPDWLRIVIAGGPLSSMGIYGGDHFDVVMSGLVGTLERAESMLHTAPYLDVTLALVVPDYRVPGFASLDAMRRSEGLRIGFVDLSRGFLDRFRDALPNSELIELPTSRTFFEEPGRNLDIRDRSGRVD